MSQVLTLGRASISSLPSATMNSPTQKGCKKTNPIEAIHGKFAQEFSAEAFEAKLQDMFRPDYVHITLSFISSLLEKVGIRLPQRLSRLQQIFSNQIKELIQYAETDVKDVTPKDIALLLDGAHFDIHNPDFSVITQNTYESIARLCSDLQLVERYNEFLNDKSLPLSIDRTETAEHMDHMNWMAQEISKDIPNIAERIAFRIGTGLHDIGKAAKAAVLSEAARSNCLTEQQRADIGNHTSPNNSFIQLLKSEIARFTAIGHHSMSEDTLAHFREVKKIDIQQLSHNDVRTIAQSLSMPEDVVMKILLRVKIIDTVSGTADLRSYRSTTNSFEHILMEVLASIHHLDAKGEYKDFVVNELSWFFDNIQIYAQKAGRTEDKFSERCNLEDVILTEVFKMSRRNIAQRIYLAIKTQDLNQLNTLIAISKHAPAENFEDAKSQLCKILNDCHIYTKSKENPQLIELEDFLIFSRFPKEILAQFKQLSYKQIMAFLQRVEPKILEEGRHNSQEMKLTGVEESEMTTILANYLKNEISATTAQIIQLQSRRLPTPAYTDDTETPAVFRRRGYVNVA